MLFRSKVASGQVKGEAFIGNGLMGIVALFLVVAACFLLADGVKALKRYREPGRAAPAEVK